MCLKTTWDKPQVAAEDIVSYKKLFKSEKRAGKYVSLFYTFYYSLNEVYKLNSEEQRVFERSNKTRINQAFHSFKENPSNALEYYAVVKCTIPKDSLYYEGKDSMDNPGYASDTIILEELLNEDVLETIVTFDDEEAVNFN